MTYIAPADVSISSSWQDHKNRQPPSKEPGTDYNVPYGTDYRMAANGVIVVVDNNNAGAEGRRLEINLDDGRVIDYLHNSHINGKIGQRVIAGQTGIALSGASGNGSDRYYGPHVHVTLRDRVGVPYANSIDFEPFTHSDIHVNTKEEEIMFIANVKGSFYLIVPSGNQKPNAVVLGGDSGASTSGIPIVNFTWDPSIAALKGAVDGIV